ncbi:MAG TPA: UPF0182 family protein [Acidimicrobiales bacterium]|nr:UPF0182 family protein [Acidimicrobiales bacterium]
MRAPDDLPRRPRRSERSNRGRITLIVGLVVIFVLLTSLRGMARFYTDYLWYDSLDQTGVWRGVLGAKIVLALLFIAIFFLLAWGNLLIADRLAPPYRLSGPEDELLERYHDLVSERTGWVRSIVAGVLALIAGTGVSAEWRSWILFTNGGDFGVTDEQFGRDVGFYVFKLPFLSFVVDWMFASLLIVLIVTTVAHYLNGGIRVQPPSPRVSPQVKAHLSVLLAALALVKAVDYWLQRFELTGSSRGVVDGALYTDVNAQLPALNLLVLISLAAAVLFVANIFRRGWTLPVLAVGLWVFVAVVAGGIYPQFVQWREVSRNETAKERPYIERNIEATRDAMGISDVRTQSFAQKGDNEDVSLAGAEPTIRNIRLWDPAANMSGQAFEQLQRIFPYYEIDDIDVDRYEIDGQPTQVNIGARTIDRASVPGDSWENEHVAYTHGYGVVMAASNGSLGTEPDFLVGNVPTQIDPVLADSGFAVDEPRIYFGEGLDGYVVVGAGRDEINYSTQQTRYDGEDGVSVSSGARRLAFALRFGDLSPLISDFMTDESRIILNRDVLDRVQALAPFLDADADPYPAVIDGRVTWIVDMYTTTSRYPYAQEADTDQVTGESGLHHDLNYVRNSVKATVDAYDGTVTFYVVDEDDPIAAAYVKAFPDLFSPADDMPDAMRSHLRYPEDLFRLQTAAYARYHLTDPDEFYTQESAWRVARDPGTAGADPNTEVTNEQGEATGETRAARIAPYYQLLQLPAEADDPPTDAEMVLMRPYVPYSEQEQSQLLTAFMAARMDPENYGKLVVYEMEGEGNTLPDGPGIAAATIGGDRDVTEARRNAGEDAEVRLGNLLLIPIDNAVLYVQPWYQVAKDPNRQLPQLTQVIVAFGDRVVIEETLQEALEAMFGQQTSTQEQPDAGTDDEGEGGGDPGGSDDGSDDPAPDEPSGTAAEQAAALLEEAGTLFDEADTALSEDGDLGRYQELVREANAKVDEAYDLLQGEEAPEDAPDTPTTTTAPA